jgi:hypothetical protein
MMNDRVGLGVVHGEGDLSRPNAIRLFGGEGRRGENGLTASGAAKVLHLKDNLTSGAVQRALFFTGSMDGEYHHVGHRHRPADRRWQHWRAEYWLAGDM